MTDYLDAIPQHIKSKVIDKDWSQTLIFELIPCTHKSDAAEFEKVDCLKCKIDTSEKWLESYLTAIKPNKTIEIDGKTLALTSMRVVRGKFDDCIGVESVWD